MKKNILIIVLLLVITVIALQLKCNNTGVIDMKAFKNKIDSLQKNIDSAYATNQKSELKIQMLQADNQKLANTKSILERRIYQIKSDTQYIQIAKSYNPNQIDSFLETRYPKEYKTNHKDTVQLPLPVVQSTIVDLVDFDKTKIVLEKTESLVSVLNEINNNKDTVILTLRNKEASYNNIIFSKDAQFSSLKFQYDMVELENKKLRSKIKINKLISFTLAGGLAVYAIFKL